MGQVIERRRMDLSFDIFLVRDVGILSGFAIIVSFG